MNFNVNGGYTDNKTKHNFNTSSTSFVTTFNKGIEELIESDKNQWNENTKKFIFNIIKETGTLYNEIPNFGDAYDDNLNDLSKVVNDSVRTIFLVDQIIQSVIRFKENKKNNEEIIKPLKDYNIDIFNFNNILNKELDVKNKNTNLINEYNTYLSKGSEILKNIDDRIVEIEKNIEKPLSLPSNENLDSLKTLSNYRIFYFDPKLFQKSVETHNTHIEASKEFLNELKEQKIVAEERMKSIGFNIRSNFPNSFTIETENVTDNKNKKEGLKKKFSLNIFTGKKIN